MLDNGLYASAVNRAYYAVFYAANALLATKRLARSKNSGVMSAFREHFTTLLQPHEQAAIDSFLARLYEDHGYRIFDSILFGSKARGDSEPDSDIDILLIVDQEDWHFRHQISDIASGIALEHGVLIGSFIIAKDRWEMMKRERFSLYENVAREGIPLLLGTD